MKRDQLSGSKWDGKRWRLRVQQDGQRKAFYSSNPDPIKGPEECRTKAIAWLDMLAHNLEPVTVAEAWTEYLADYSKTHARSSVKTATARGRVITAYMGRRNMASITGRDLVACLQYAKAQGMQSISTLKALRSLLVGFCRFAASLGWLDYAATPQLQAIPLPDAKQGRARTILSPEDLTSLLDPSQDLAGEWYGEALRFLALTGLRRGELCALQIGRDYDGETLTVRESRAADGTTSQGKTSNARRTIVLGRLARACIARHQEQRERAGLRSSGYLFVGPSGDPINPGTLWRAWDRWRKAHNVTITLHELRHTYASYATQAADVDQLRPILGHSEHMDTAKTYIHALPLTAEQEEQNKQQAERTANNIDRVFRRYAIA